jgi:hypothetical protein
MVAVAAVVVAAAVVTAVVAVADEEAVAAVAASAGKLPRPTLWNVHGSSFNDPMSCGEQFELPAGVPRTQRALFFWC